MSFGRGIHWVEETALLTAQRALLYLLSSGPIPRHVAFIMDGNRRYARALHKRPEQGHEAGYLALRRMLEICLKLNIRCVSVYAFAMDNFKRPKIEVDTLMDLAETRLAELCDNGDLLEQYGVKLNIIGRKELFPDSVRAAMDRAEEITRQNKNFILNFCVAYSSRDEITTAVESCVRKAIQDGPNSTISVDDIDAELMMSKSGSPPLDILIRSSGVTRLSDFLLWQCCEDTQIHFCPTNWPDFTFWDLLPILLNYQRKVWSEAKRAKY